MYLQLLPLTDQVILSAGAINTPQLMMLSGIGPADHLRQMDIPVIRDLPGVGQHLMDHYGTGSLVFTIDQAVSLTRERCLSTSN